MAYIDQLKQAFNFRTNTVEALARTAGATLLASLALNGLEDSGMNTGIPPVYEHGATPAHVEKHVEPGGTHYEPAKLGRISIDGPSVYLNFLQTYAPEFRAAPFNRRQSHQLDGVLGEFRAVFRKHPDARVMVRIQGTSSDESEVDSRHGDQNLGLPSVHNRRLARQRGELVEQYIHEQPTIKGDIHFQTTGKEEILTTQPIYTIDSIARQHKLSRGAFLKAYNNGHLRLDGSERFNLLGILDGRRGAYIDSTITYKTKQFAGPCDQVVRLVTTSDHEVTERVPGKDGWDIHLLPFIIPPLPRWRRSRRAPRPKAPRPTVPSGPATPAKKPHKTFSRRQERRIRERVLAESLGHDERMLKTFETGPYKDSHTMQAMRQEYAESVRDTSRQLRGIRLRRRLVRGLITAALLPLLPFPWETTNDRKNRLVQQRCSTVEYDYGRHTELFGNLAGVAIVRAIEGRDDWNKQWDIGPIDSPDKVTYTTKPYDRIIVDKKGKIIERQQVPPTSNTVLR